MLVMNMCKDWPCKPIKQEQKFRSGGFRRCGEGLPNFAEVDRSLPYTDTPPAPATAPAPAPAP